ncbi:hypothetical protein MUK42_32891 [Musa troglodytarum]|uniref:Uncharacterized protein n=1 Tax=Musa troglodytarum TaxID=320322 RepID=A0A9E7L4J6_9LILI|nr:hypothetical protein MUK42_32891 [Musa troglodytarum]
MPEAVGRKAGEGKGCPRRSPRRCQGQLPRSAPQVDRRRRIGGSRRTTATP